tara:strand:+ start:3249 stop:3716 length:468 start_codon:yes stop_codon:yes gene_type:complete
MIVAALLVMISLPSTAADHKMDIVDTAVSAGIFETLVAAVSAAGLVDTLKGEGPLTVFAPNDDAFAKLPSGTVESLLKPENIDQLVAILTYHVIPGRILSGELPAIANVATVQGSTIEVKKDDEVVTVNQATVIQADVEATNGVIHIIDQVIIPK